MSKSCQKFLNLDKVAMYHNKDSRTQNLEPFRLQLIYNSFLGN